MYIPSRERKMLELLLNANQYSTVKDLALELDVSERTIHRDLKSIDGFLGNYFVALVKKSGAGVILKGTADNKSKLKNALSAVASLDYTPEERKTIILAALFATKEPVKLFTLANDLNVTIATVSNDLDEVEKLLDEYQLSLTRRRGYGVQIEGEERNKRAAIRYLITTYIDPIELVTMYKENVEKGINHDHKIADRLLGFVQAEDLKVIEQAVDKMKHGLHYELADNAYIGLIVHLALAIERLKNGDVIQFDQEYLQQIKETSEFNTATTLIHALEKTLKIEIPEDEIGYITMHLLGAKLRVDHHFVIEDSAIDIAYKAKELIHFVSTELGVELHHSATLLNDLVAHLKPAIYRMKKEMKIINPLIEDIQHDYKELFQLLEDGVKAVFPNMEFPKDEIGFLVLHFGSELFYNESIRDVKALIICSSGIGTARILATRLLQQFPEITHVENKSMFEIKDIDTEAYDIVLSTVTLMDYSKPYIVVSPILSKEEMHQIRQSLRKQLLTNRKSQPKRFEPKKEHLLLLEDVQRYSKIVTDILKGFTVIHWKEPLTLKLWLHRICERLAEDQYINDAEQVLDQLFERHHMGGLGLPGTTLALYHTRTMGISEPHFSVFKLEHPVLAKGMDSKEQLIDTILIMLAPKNAGEEALEVLSFISSLLIQHEEAIETFTSGNEEQSKSYLASELYGFLKDKNFI